MSNKKKKILQTIDLFAGIGGIRLGFDSVGCKCVFSSEYDEYAKNTYKANFGEEPFGDITKITVNDIPDHDILLAGFPCQPFSLAGKKGGFSDTRGTLFFNIENILKGKLQHAFLLENVKNLQSHDKGKTFSIIEKHLVNIGYNIKYKVLNSMTHGNIPQNRERIFIVGFLSKEICDRFVFPEPIPLTKTIHDCIVKEKVDNKYYYDGKPLYDRVKDEVNSKETIYQWRRKYVRVNKKNVCPTLTANMGCGGHNVPIILDDFGIRRLTPRECSNFQGFPDTFVFPNISDSHLYKQIGNSVSIDVIKRIAQKIKESIEN